MIKISFLASLALAILAGILCTVSVPCLAQGQADITNQRLFYSSFDKGLNADFSTGDGKSTTMGEVRLTQGVRGQAVLVGQKDYLSFPLQSNVRASAGSIAFWAKTLGWNGSDGQFHYFVSMTGPQHWMILQTAEGTLAFLGRSRTAYSRSGTSIADWRDGEWRHVVVTWDTGKAQLYLDGKPASSVQWPVVPTELGEQILLGGQLFNSSQGLTAIDEFTTYGSALTAEQIARLYATDVAASPLLQQTIFRTTPKMESNNLVRRELGTIVLPSSQSASAEDVVENVMDGNFDTKWVSATGSFPNWLEVRWPQPVTAHAIVLQEHRQTRIARYRVESYGGGRWKEIVPTTANTGAPGTALKIEFPPLQTTQLRIHLLLPVDSEEKTASFVSELQVLGTSDQTQALKRMSKPAWQSHWIWYPEGEVANVVRYFRKSFSVPDLKAIQQAYLQIGADDAYEVFLNGHRIGSGNIPTQLYEVTKYLRQGDNALAVKAQEFDLFEGVIAELTLNTNGGIRRIVTDQSWKSFNQQAEGWTAPNFDDAQWKLAQERGIPPRSQHADQRYFNVAAKESFVLKGVQIAPSTRPGQRAHIKLQVSVPKVVQHDYSFVLRVGDAPLTQYGDFTVVTKAFLPSQPTSQWKPGQTYSLAVDVYLPEWAPHGDIPVFLTPVGSGVEGELDKAHDRIGALHIQKFATTPKPWAAKPAQAEVRQEQGRPVLYVNGKVLPPYIQTIEAYASYQGMGQYARTGNHLWRLWGQKGLQSPYQLDNPQQENAQFFKVVDQLINNLLKVDPDAYILFGTQLRVPKEWTDKYPDDATLLADGQHLEFSLSSGRWLKKTQDDMRALVNHLQSQPYAGHVIGLHFDLAGETYYWGYNANSPGVERSKLLVGDYSPEHVRAFRLWLRAHYKNDVKELQSAWKDTSVDFDTAIPDLKTLQREDLIDFRDPALTRMPYDYWQFHSEAMADRVNDIARTIKEASGGRFITGFWGLYSNGFNAATSSPGKVPHVAYAGLQKVLREPWVDYIANLQAYAHTRWGSPMVPTNLAQSIRSHGKLMLVEYDMRTFFTSLVYESRTFSQAESLAVIQRDVAAAAMHGDAMWWVGFGEGTEGRTSVPWYNEDGLLKALKTGKEVYKATAQANPRSVAEVAVFANNADVYALDALSAHSVLQSAQYNPIYFQFPLLGAPADFYELEDIERPEMERYKVFVFLNAYNLSPQQREQIKARVRKAGKTAVWLYAPGFSDGKNLSTDFIRDLTGFNVEYEKRAMVPEIRLEAGHALTRDIPQNYSIRPTPYEFNSGPFQIGPIFNVADPTAQTLGRYVHNGKTAYAVKSMGGPNSTYNSIFLTIPYIDAPLLRSICRFAGVHLYTQQAAYLDATHDFLTLTAGPTGYRQSIQLPRSATVYDIFNRQILARGVKEFQPQIPPLKTGFYFVGTDAEIDALRARLQAAN